MAIYWIVLLLNFLVLQKVDSRGIKSKVGASCIQVAADFISFPFNCEAPDLAFKCRCQDLAFLGTVTNCIESHATDPRDLAKAYKQLVATCKAQGGKFWSFIDLVKLNENATNYMVDYQRSPITMHDPKLIWKDRKIYQIQISNVATDSGNSPESFKSDSIMRNPYILEDDAEDIKRFFNSSSEYILFNPVIVPKDLYDTSFKSISNLVDQRNIATLYGSYLYIYWGIVMFIAIVFNIIQWTSPYLNNQISGTRFSLWCKNKIICSQIIKPRKILNSRSNSTLNKIFNKMIDSSIGLFIGEDRVRSQNKQLNCLSSMLLNGDNQVKLNELNTKLRKIKGNSSSNNNNSKGYINNKILKFNRNCKNSILNSIYTLPVRMHAIVIMGYLILNIIFCCINYKIVYPNTIFTSNKDQNFVSIADRTGIIGTVQLPIVYLFSTRNNIFSNITGFSYRTFQMFHKWISRTVFVLLILHCSFYLMYVNVKGDYIERWGLLKWRCANAAIAAISITILFSFFRKFIYEWFKLSHKILLIIFSIGAWYHCLTLGWIEYLAIAYFIWGVEYLIRLSKIILSGGILKGRCNVIYDTSSMVPHSIRMVVNHSGWWKQYPCCYCWIYILKYGMFWESHPFTVVSTISAENYNQLVFIIRVKDGLTKRLANYISKQPGGKCDINILIEGPYGNNIPFKQYYQSVLVAGGVGMSVIYSMAIDLAQIYRAQQLRGKREEKMINDKGKFISLIWVIPNFESLLAFKAEIESLKKFKGIIEIQIFITKRLSDVILQDVIDEKNLRNPFSLLVNEYEKRGFEGFVNTLIKKSTIEIQSSDAGYLGFTSSNELAMEKNHDKSLSRNIERIYSNTEDNNYDVIREQRLQQIEFLKCLIANNGEQISISFEDKPFLEKELSNFIINLKNIQPTVLIACGPTNLNSDVRLSVNECLENGCFIDYYEQELLW